MINKNYPYQNWILTIVFGPIIWILYEIVFNGQHALSMFEGVFVFITIGLLYSLPVLAINSIVFKLLIKITSSFLLIKFIIVTIGVIGIVVTLKLVGGTLVLKLSLSYSLALILSGVLIKLKLVDKIETGT